MINAKKKFNIVDFLIIFLTISITATTIIRIYVVKNFENNFSPAKAVVTLSVENVDENILSKIKSGDKIYIFNKFGNTPIGIVSVVKPVKSIVNSVENKSDSYIKTDVNLEISMSGSTNNQEDFILGTEKIEKGTIYSASNGVIGFECKVISVKISH